MDRQPRTLLIWAALLLVAVVPFVFSAWSRRGGETRDKLTLSQFLSVVKSEEVANVSWQGHEISGQLTNGRAYRVTAPDPDSVAAEPVIEALQRSRSNWQIDTQPLVAPLVPLLWVVAVPLAILAAVLFLVYLFLLRPILRAASGGTGA